MAILKFRIIVFIVAVIASCPVQASCLNTNADGRLSTYCVAEALNGSVISLNEAVLLDALLQREGFNVGAGFRAAADINKTQTFLSPLLEYNTNINGGNPNRPLVLGGLTFKSDEENLRRKGFMTGAVAGLNGRTVYGNGRYLDYTGSIRHVYSFKHDMGISRASVDACSRNHIANQWYLDACGNATRLVRDLVSETNKNLLLNTSAHFRIGDSVFHKASFGVRRYYTSSYEQNQIQLALDTVRSKGAYTGFQFNFGEAIANTLVMRRSVNATLGTTLFERALTVNVAYSYADGGRLLGFVRNDDTLSLTFKYAFNDNYSATIGYRAVDSTIEYFSEREPILGLHYSALRF